MCIRDSYKEAIDELRPFEGDLLSQIKNYYRIGLTWTSNALEGNTLTESETKVLLEDGLTCLLYTSGGIIVAVKGYIDGNRMNRRVSLAGTDSDYTTHMTP